MATALGTFVIIVPWAILSASLVFAGIVYKWRYISIGSMAAAVSLPVLIALLSYSKTYVVPGVIMAVIIIYKHQENIKRLLSGEESRVGSE